MKKIAIFGVMAMLSVFLARPAHANDFTVGYRSLQGHVYGADGYWHFNGQRYIGTKYTNPSYYANGCYVSGGWYLAFTPYYAPTYVAPYVPTYVPPVAAAGVDIDLQMLLIAKSKLESAERRLADREKAEQRLKLAEALGIRQEAAALGYLSLPPSGYSVNGSFYSNTYPVQASTSYGYSLSQVLKSQETDAVAALQQLVAQAQNNAASGLKQFADNAAQAEALRAKNAGEKQQIDALVLALTLVRTPQTATQAGGSFSIQKEAPAPLVMPSLPGEPAKAAAVSKEAARIQLANVLVSRCADCHFATAEKKAKGGFSINDYFGMNRTDKSRVLKAVQSDCQICMPPADRPKLTAQEKAAFDADRD